MKLRPELSVRGVTAPSLTPYIVVRKGERTAWIPHTMLTNEHASKMEAARQGLVLLGSEWKGFLEEAANVDQFPLEAVIEAPGWNGPDFILPNGAMVAREGNQSLPIIFKPNPRTCQTTGTRQGFRDGVIDLLRGQHLLTMLLCINFAAPLLPLTARVGNFGFQIVGDGGTGKSTAQRIAAATCGSDYWISFNTTLEAIEQKMQLYHSMPAWIDEVNLFGADKAASARGAMLRAVAFRLASGDLKSRFDDEHMGRTPFIYVASGNDTLEELMSGSSKATSGAAIDRLMTLKLGSERKHGVLDFVPAGYGGGKHFIESLEAAANANAGHIMLQFLECLVAELEYDEEGVLAQIKADMDRFSERAGIGQDDGSKARVGDAFGLPLAGGLLARRFGIYRQTFRSGTPSSFAISIFWLARKPLSRSTCFSPTC